MKKIMLALAVVATALTVGLAVMPIVGATAEGGNKVVVCKYVGTPGGVLDHIVIVDDNTLGNAQQPWPGTLPFIWTDAQGQTTVGSIAVRYANEGEQAHDVPLSDCPQAPPTTTPPPPREVITGSLSTPVCTNQNIVATGDNPTDAPVTFDVFVNGTLVDSFIVAAHASGTSASIPVKDNDVVTLRIQGGENLLLDAETVNLDCVVITTTPPPVVPPVVPPTTCTPSVKLGPWYGDPRVNIDLKGDALFVIKGGVQRFTGQKTITADLACNQTLRVGRYKVKAGHHLIITQDGVVVVDEVPPVLR